MSPQKHAAQLANAQQSSGPRTAEGKARSSQNSTRHSLCGKKYLIAPEDRAEFNLHYNELLAALAPEGAIESKLAEAIVIDEWRLTRARTLESEIFARGHMKSKDGFLDGAETWLAHAKELALLTLYEQRINRVLARNKAELEAKQATRKAAAQPAESKAKPAASEHDPAFVPSNAASIPSSAGFVHSSSPISSPEVPLTAPEPIPIPLAETRRAA
jgi:hypothetical protein